MKNQQPRVKRKFLGKVSNFENKEERNFEKAHLKAYLKGHTNFRHGFHEIKGLRMPKWHNVKQEIYVSEPVIGS